MTQIENYEKIELFVEMKRLFLKEAPKVKEKMIAELFRRDSHRLEGSIHYLASLSASIGLSKITRVCQQAIESYRKNNHREFIAQVNALVAKIEDAQQEIEKAQIT